MKKNLFLVWACIIVSILFSTTSCGSTGVTTIHQDPALPWQEHALLLPSGNYKGLVYVHGLYDPNKKSYPNPTIGANKVGLIPPGTQTIMVSTKDVGYNPSKPFQMTYEFLPGQRYVIAIVESRRGLLTGTFTPEIHTVEEYRVIYGEMYPNNDESDFKRWILDRFDKAEAELSK